MARRSRSCCSWRLSGLSYAATWRHSRPRRYTRTVRAAPDLSQDSLLKALPGAFLVPLVTSGSDRVRRERLLIATVVPRALLLGVAAAAMTVGGQGVPSCARRAGGRLASAFRQVQPPCCPGWLALPMS